MRLSQSSKAGSYRRAGDDEFARMRSIAVSQIRGRVNEIRCEKLSYPKSYEIYANIISKKKLTVRNPVSMSHKDATDTHREKK